MTARTTPLPYWQQYIEEQLHLLSTVQNHEAVDHLETELNGVSKGCYACRKLTASEMTSLLQKIKEAAATRRGELSQLQVKS